MPVVVPIAEYQRRRNALLKRLEDADEPAIAVIAGAELVTRSNDTEYPFRQNSDFYYLTGFNEPDAVLVLAPHAEVQVQLYCQPKDPQQEVWHGRRLGVARAVEQLGVDVAHPIDELDEHLWQLFDGVHTVYCDHSQQDFFQHLLGIAAELRSSGKRGVQPPLRWQNCAPWLHRMRLVKSEAEIQVMREAARISVRAHQRAMRFVKAGRFEYQVAAELHHEFAMHGAAAPAYGTICGSGENACILHYTENSDELKDGDLLLIDAGAEYQGYAADITRTFPVNGKFTEPQRQLYEVVLRAQEASLAVIKPGGTLQQAQEVASRALTEGLVELGILNGSVNENMQQATYRRFFIHGLGHWLGLDVHDVGDVRRGDKSTPFQPGMVLTVEPGLYIPQDATDVEAQWRGLGIRIEDDVVVTVDGHENLTAEVPKVVAEIEAWMQSK